MKNNEELEQRIFEIEKRNKRVELDKQWEGSTTRKILVGLLTYVVISIFFLFIRVDKPLINAIVPTLGFLISTLSLSLFKKWWIEKNA